MLKAFLFDMDGVLYDSMPHHADAWYHVMHDVYGLTCTRELFFRLEGATGDQVITDLFLEQRDRQLTLDEARAIYREKGNAFRKLGPAAPMPGAAEVLRKVGEQRLTRVLVTGSGQLSMLDRLNRDYPECFDTAHIVSAKDTPIGHGKPHPDPYLMGLKKAGNLLPDEAIVVENAPLGVQAGKAAGIFTVGVNTGPLPKTCLSDAGADLVLDSMQELADSFDKILSIYHKSSEM